MRSEAAIAEASLFVPLPPDALHLRRTLTLQKLGKGDPSATLDDALFQKSFMLESGDTTRHTLHRRDDGLEVTVEGPSPEEQLQHWRTLFPLRDGADEFRPSNERLRELTQSFSGLRLLRVPWLFDIAAGAVLQQRVSFVSAARSFARIADEFGTTGPLGTAFPNAKRLNEVPGHALERLGVDRKRIQNLRALAKEQLFCRFLSRPTEGQKIRQRMMRIRGIGPWTTEMTLGFGVGDPDALPLGDLSLPSIVCNALAGESEASDARMQELLEPYAGHRFRVVRLLMAAKLNR